MSSNHPAERLDDLVVLARAAGEAILAVYRRGFSVETKHDNSPLTEADRASHRCLTEGLAQIAPQIPLLSEEGRMPAFDTRRQWQRYWLIDPLDGTKEFIKRNGEFTVNIALIEGGRPVLGVVHAPERGITYAGLAGEGAFREDASVRVPIRTRRLDADTMTLVVSRSHRGAAIDQLLTRLPAHQTTSVGSSLKFCLVAEGQADLYPRFGPTSEWDTAAAQCVVEAAGGRVTRVDLSPLRYNTKESLLNPDFLVLGDPDYDWAAYLAGFEVEER